MIICRNEPIQLTTFEVHSDTGVMDQEKFKAQSIFIESK